MISSCKTLKETRWCLSHFHIVNIVFITLVSHTKFHINQWYTSIFSKSTTPWCIHPIITLTRDRRTKKRILIEIFWSLTFTLFRRKACMKFPFFPPYSSTGFNCKAFAFENTIFPISSRISFLCYWLFGISNDLFLVYESYKLYHMSLSKSDLVSWKMPFIWINIL